MKDTAKRVLEAEHGHAGCEVRVSQQRLLACEKDARLQVLIRAAGYLGRLVPESVGTT